MQVNAIGPGCAILTQQPVQRVFNGLGIGATVKPHQRLVEPAFHVIGRGQGRPPHPDHSKARVIRHQFARRGGVKKLGALRQTDNPKLALGPVHRGDQFVTRVQTPGFRKPFQDHDLVSMPRAWGTPGREVKVIEPRATAVRQGNRLGPDRQFVFGHVNQRAARHPRFHRRHAFDLGNAFDHPVGRACHRGKDIGQPVSVVIGNAGLIERVHQPAHHHLHQHAQPDYCRYCRRLAFHPRQIAQEFAVKRAHHSISAGSSLVSLTTISRIAPSAK